MLPNFSKPIISFPYNFVDGIDSTYAIRIRSKKFYQSKHDYYKQYMHITKLGQSTLRNLIGIVTNMCIFWASMCLDNAYLHLDTTIKVDDLMQEKVDAIELL